MVLKCDTVVQFVDDVLYYATVDRLYAAGLINQFFDIAQFHEEMTGDKVLFNVFNYLADMLWNK